MVRTITMRQYKCEDISPEGTKHFKQQGLTNGGKKKTQQNQQGFQENQKTSLDEKLTARKSDAEFQST